MTFQHGQQQPNLTSTKYIASKIKEAHIITGALKTTPINRIESITSLQPMEDRRPGRVLQQAEKFKRLPQHPMHQRIKGLEKGRFKRNNFRALARAAIRKNEALASPVEVSLKGSRQIRSVTSGKGLALRAGSVGPGYEAGLRWARAGRSERAATFPWTTPAVRRRPAVSPASADIQQPTQNWYGSGNPIV
jgi:hypothetical protein